MTNEVSYTHIPDFPTQVDFAKHYAERGFEIIATALSWKQAMAVADLLKEQGVQANAAAIEPLVQREELFQSDTFVLWCEAEPSAIEEAKPLVQALRNRAEQSESAVRIAQNSEMDVSELRTRKRVGIR